MQWELPAEEEPELPGKKERHSFPVFLLLMYLCAAALVVLIALLTASWIRNRFAPRLGTQESFQLAPPEIELSSRPLDLAKEAALRGDHSEAIHLLLLGTIEEIRASLGYEAPPWWTSREIVRLAPLPTCCVHPLEQIVAAVERTHFGEANATKEDFVACAEWHAELRAAARQERGPRGD